MADYIVPKDFKTMDEIWNELLRLHWNYLDTEENMEKLKMRRKLEDDLKDFLSMVQHDRKFFLPDTAHVFKQSVMRMDKFSAYKALMGFEAISQYANNLFRKPWRKEYRCVKMYSGYYQHEVKTNLVDAERMFEAMGYTLLPNQTLVLDGPICPDQVTNVSRDAMTAYVECQIMKQIFQGLIAMQLQTTWQEIYEYREKHIVGAAGNASQAIRAMAYAIERRQLRSKDKQFGDNCFSQPSTTTVYSQICSTPSAPHIHHTSNHSQPVCCNDQDYHSNAGKSAYSALYATPTPAVCPPYGLTHGTSTANTSYPYDNHHHHHHHQHHMPHSKSFEHYHEPAKLLESLTLRHSFDNYKNYDCIDAGASNGHHARQPHPLGVGSGSSGGGGGGGGGVGASTAADVMPFDRFHTLPSAMSGGAYADPQHAYSHVGDRSIDAYSGMGACCHQSPHYDCLTAFGGRTSALPKPGTGHDYGNYNFQSK